MLAPKQSLETAKLIMEACNELSLELAIEGHELDAPLTTRIKPGFNTAAWTFNRGAHTIFMGDSVFPWERAKELTEAEQKDVYKALYRHELAHAEHTTRDFAAMNAMCARAKCDFSLLNLFEDARIEHKTREDTGASFGWASFMEKGPDTSSPMGLFFSMIESETREVKAQDPELFERVQKFYDRVTSASNTSELEPILKDWVLEFSKQNDQQNQQGQPQPGQGSPGQGQDQSGQDGQGGSQGQDSQPQPGQQGQSAGQGQPGDKSDDKGPGGKGSDSITADRGEMPMSAQLSDDKHYDAFAEDAKTLQEVLAEVEAAEGKISGSKKDGKDPDKDEGALPALPGGPNTGRGTGAGAMSKQEALDWKESQEVATILRKAMQGVNRAVATDVPSKKLNVKGFTRPGAPMFRRKELQGRKCLNVMLVVDISGSMSGEPIRNARVLAGALAVLAREGLVQGQVLLSGTSYNKLFDLKSKEVQADVEAIAASGGGEGFVKNFTQHQKALLSRDAVLVFTDANTERVDQATLAARKIYPVGLYCGHDTGAPEQLRENFNRSLVRDSLKELAFSLVGEFSRASKAQQQVGSGKAGQTLSKVGEPGEVKAEAEPVGSAPGKKERKPGGVSF